VQESALQQEKLHWHLYFGISTVFVLVFELY